MIINQVNLAGIYKAFNTLFQEALAAAPTQWGRVAMEVPSGSRSNDYKWLGNFPTLREWIGERAIKSLTAFKYELANKDYEGTIEVDKNDILDDQIGLYTPMLQGLGQSAAQHPDTLVFTLLKAGGTTLCYDGQFFFDIDHPEGTGTASNFGGGAGTEWYLMDTSRPIKPLIFQRRSQVALVGLDQERDENVFMRRKFIYGVDYRGNVGFGFWQMAYSSKDTLNAANYAAARAAIMSRKNDDGIPLGLVPNLLVVPPTLESAGRALVKAQTDAAGAANVWFNTADLLVATWLA